MIDIGVIRPAPVSFSLQFGHCCTLGFRRLEFAFIFLLLLFFLQLGVDKLGTVNG